MQWDKIKTFYYVAKFQSVTKAAQYLNIAQPAVSRQMMDLERQIGQKLFKRLSKGLALTKQGQILFQNAEKMYAFSELALVQLQEEALEVQGDLRIGTNVGLVDTWLYKIIPDFLQAYPQVNLSIFAKDSPLDVESHDVEVALQPYNENQPDLIQNFLMSWDRRLYASKEYLQRYGVPQSPTDLIHHKLIAFGPEKIHLFENINWHLKLSDPKQFQKPYLSTNSLRTLFHLGNSGIGIISFSQESPLLIDSNLIEILPNKIGPRINIYFTYPSLLQGIKKINVLEDFLKSYVQKHHRKYVSPHLI